MGDLFADRVDAGRQLARRLRGRTAPDAVVLGIPRGGVEVAFGVAMELHLPLDVAVVRKLGAPDDPELALGAVGEDGVRVLNDEIVRQVGVGPDELADAERRERQEVERRALAFRLGQAARALGGRTAIVVDDGLATGATARAACRVARERGATHVVLAVPVASDEALAAVGHDADEIVCLEVPEHFFALGRFYGDFSPTPDSEVSRLLAEAARAREAGGRS
jgi:putative phosphoribosyl transferase